MDTFSKLRTPSDYAVFDRVHGILKTEATEADALAFSVMIVDDGTIKYPILVHILAIHVLQSKLPIESLLF